MPGLETITISDDEKDSDAVELNGGYCKSEAKPLCKIDNNHRLSAGAPTINMSKLCCDTSQ